MINVSGENWTRSRAVDLRAPTVPKLTWAETALMKMTSINSHNQDQPMMANQTAPPSDPRILPFTDLPGELRQGVYLQILPPKPVAIHLMRAAVPIVPPKLEWRKKRLQVVCDEDMGPTRIGVIELPTQTNTSPEGKLARYQLQHTLRLMKSCRWVYMELAPLFYAKLRPTADFSTAKHFVDIFGPVNCPLKEISLQATQTVSMRSLTELVQSMPALENLTIELWKVPSAKIGDGAVRTRWALRRLNRILAASSNLEKVLVVQHGGVCDIRVVRLTSKQLVEEKGETELKISEELKRLS